MRLIVLEDNADRQNEMQRIVGDRMPQYSFEFFNDVAAMIERLDTTGLYDVALISLDHDLDLISSSDGSHIDPGTGVDAAKWFAMQPALAPLIVHTTNTLGGDRMMDILLECGWHCSRIVPYSGEDWINESWFPLVRKLVRENNIDLRQVRGTGAGGRVTKSDVEAYLATRTAPDAAPVAAPAWQAPASAAPAAPALRRRFRPPASRPGRP